MSQTKPLTVAALVEFLQGQEQDMLVAYSLHSEYNLMTLSDIAVTKLCEARPDGWIHMSRNDKPTVNYLTFPGN